MHSKNKEAALLEQIELTRHICMLKEKSSACNAKIVELQRSIEKMEESFTQSKVQSRIKSEELKGKKGKLNAMILQTVDFAFKSKENIVNSQNKLNHINESVLQEHQRIELFRKQTEDILNNTQQKNRELQAQIDKNNQIKEQLLNIKTANDKSFDSFDGIDKEEGQRQLIKNSHYSSVAIISG